MFVPVKAINFKNFRPTGAALPPSGHAVMQGTYLDDHNEAQFGFLKPIDSKTYLRMLALGSVGISVHMEMFMGGQVARDYLVYKDNKIYGTCSKGLIEFTCMLALGEKIPTDVQKRELSCPPAATMMNKGMTTALVGSLLTNDDDAHNGNLGWAVINDDGCGFEYMDSEPEADRLDEMHARSCYILTDIGFYYFNKSAKNLEFIPMEPEKLSEVHDFFLEIGRKKRLYDSQLRRIIKLTERVEKDKDGRPVKDKDTGKDKIIKHLPDDMIRYVLIDHDLRYADEWAEALKSLRLVDGIIKEVPAKALVLKGSDITNFPNVSGRTFFPSYLVPGNGNISRSCMNYASVRDLARNPAIQTERGYESFQQQMFFEHLKYLVTYDPRVYRARLDDNLGEEPLDFMSLPEASIAALRKRDILNQHNYPSLYTQETNERPFAEYMVNLVQQHYDVAYKNTVFYPGRETNEHQVPVMSFYQYIQNNPSAWRRILDWANNQNEKQEGQWSSPEAYFNPVRLEQRYHQIWRDSRILIMQECLFLCKKLSRRLASELRLDSHTLPSSPEPIRPDAPELKAAWPLLSTLFGSDDLTLETDCAQDSSMKQGLILLNQMISDLRQCCSQYYELPADRLSDTVNKVHAQAIKGILTTYKNKIADSLNKTTFEEPFDRICTMLIQYHARLDFALHREAANPEPGHITPLLYSNLLYREHTDKDVVDSALKTLFDWANSLDAEEFSHYIAEIIELYYKPADINIFSPKCRGEEVATYLKTSQESGANKLARILSTGGTEPTSLNTKIIEHLMPLMLQASIGRVDCNLHSLEHARQHMEFNLKYYTEQAIDYARGDARFTHFYSNRSVRLVNDALYNWVDKMKRDEFIQLMNRFIDKYDKKIFLFFKTRQRGDDVRPKLKDPTQSNRQILAYVFGGGKTNDGRLSTIVFKGLLELMQTMIPSNRKDAMEALRNAKTEDAIREAKGILAETRSASNEFILQIQPKNSDHFLYFLKTLKDNAAAYSLADTPASPAVRRSMTFSKPVSITAPGKTASSRVSTSLGSSSMFSIPVMQAKPPARRLTPEPVLLSDSSEDDAMSLFGDDDMSLFGDDEAPVRLRR
ncbi:hypothetical protein [Legionella sp. CNM-4043-24]|uniref:hypothetical protein n=1 Tax=Legionella sp. CNM-4043-24 TaxID=3421646 RepID=UPI00403B12C5